MKMIVTEELSKVEKDQVKDLIRSALLQLFYTLYTRKSFWA